jgi:class 3 adenylate cyclase
MIALSFRIKLLLAMMILVVGVTGATLYVTQEKVQATYMKLFQDQFTAEVNYFTTQQEDRLAPEKERCERLAKSPEFRATLAAGESDKIYEFATNFLVQQNVTAQRPLRAGARALNAMVTGGGQRNQFFRVLNAKGEILHFPDPRGAIKVVARRRLETQLAAVQHAMATLDEQPVGYIAPERTNGAIELLEVIVTKISDPDTKETLGALVLGVPFLETSEKPIFELSQGGIESGIWVDDHVHSKTIPDELRDDFERIIAAKVKPGTQPRDTMDLMLGKEPRRAFFKLLNPNSPFPPAYQVSLYSLNSALKTQRELRWQIVAFSAAALGGALLLSMVLAHGLSIPLRQLVKGTVEIRGGNFRYKVPVRSRDEIGELALSFNEMAEGLTQKELYRTVLNMVADEKVAQALMNGQLALGGEVREVTVVFCDIRGFTAMTQNMPPEEVIEMLNEHMTALTRVVKENNGVLDKFVGDLLMALFGAPVQHAHDSINAARCALQLVQERERLNATSRHQLQIGVGVATGKVVAGCMGAVDRLNYTVLGERVNLASRLCEHAGPGKVLIDQTTKDKLGEKARTAQMETLNLKGFSENVVAYELLEVDGQQS